MPCPFLHFLTNGMFFDNSNLICLDAYHIKLNTLETALETVFVQSPFFCRKYRNIDKKEFDWIRVLEACNNLCTEVIVFCPVHFYGKSYTVDYEYTHYCCLVVNDMDSMDRSKLYILIRKV